MNDNIKAEVNPLDTVEDIYENAVLLDFYGQLLTDRQYEIMDLYYNSDLSLGEIAENLGISRQGVHDSIRKAKQALLGYEKRLGLAERFREQEKIVEKALNSLKHIGKKSPELLEDSDYKQAMALLGKILETL
ncbi:MAG: YlxM family DNA-binding protein [Acetivibrionales bacterium]